LRYSIARPGAVSTLAYRSPCLRLNKRNTVTRVPRVPCGDEYHRVDDGVDRLCSLPATPAFFQILLWSDAAPSRMQPDAGCRKNMQSCLLLYEPWVPEAWRDTRGPTFRRAA